MGYFSFTEKQIREQSTPQTYKRGADYAKQGAVVSLVRRGDMLEAEVEGSEPEPYQVSVSLRAGEIETAVCDCDYMYEGWCKHIVAALLQVLKNPGEIEERTPVSELLAGRSADELHDLLLTLTEKHPKIADDIEKWTRKNRQGKSAKTAAPSEPDAATIDPKPYQKQMRTILRSAMQESQEYYSEDDPLDVVAEQAGELLDEAKDFLKVGEARNAAVILQAVTDGIAGEMDELTEMSGGYNEIFSDLGAAWIETMLAGEWTPNEKAEWTKRLYGWGRKLSDWGGDAKFEAASIALAQGWDFPPLVAVLSGERRDWLGLADGEEDAATTLAEMRVAILRRENRLTEAANLAETAGMHQEYAEILVALNQINEAVNYAREKITYPATMHKIALLLADKGAKAEAIALGTHGLNLGTAPNATVDMKLAEWLLDYGRENDAPEIAMKAGVAFVLGVPSLKTWKKLSALAGTAWENLRTELLADLLARSNYNVEGKADIFLTEGLYAEAVSLVRKSGDSELVGRVADVAAHHVPQDVLEISRERAESLMNATKAPYYPEAARWLRRAKTAYLNLHADSEWQTYILGIKSKHRQKRNLMPLINDL